MMKYLKYLLKLNIKTFYFNFKYLPFKQAIKLPVLLSRKVCLKKCSGKLIFDCDIKPGLVKIGYGEINIFDRKKSRTIWEVRGTLVLKGAADIGHGSKISIGPDGILILGKNFIITAETTLVVYSKIQFGNDCLLSWDTLIIDTDFHKIKDISGNVTNAPRPIIIGNKVWIGCRCLILKGAVIPDNCVIAANSMVNKALEHYNCLYAGSPVRPMRDDVVWEM